MKTLDFWYLERVNCYKVETLLSCIVRKASEGNKNLGAHEKPLQ